MERIIDPGPAPRRFSAYQQDHLAVGVVDLDADGVLVPHLDVDVAGEVVDVELGAFGDRHRLIGWRDDHQRQEKIGKHGVL